MTPGLNKRWRRGTALEWGRDATSRTTWTRAGMPRRWASRWTSIMHGHLPDVDLRGVGEESKRVWRRNSKSNSNSNSNRTGIGDGKLSVMSPDGSVLLFRCLVAGDETGINSDSDSDSRPRESD